MADNDDAEGTTNTRKNDWEVVSLTASTYAASPGPDEVEGTQVNTEDETETSRPLFMSDHFVFPPSQHENLPLEAEDNEIPEQQEGSYDTTELGLGGSKPSVKDEKDHTSDTVNEELAEHFFDEKGVNLSTHKPGLEEGSHYSATDSSLDETSISGPTLEELAEESEVISDLPADLSQLPNPIKEEEDDDDDEFYESELPPGAWWKKRAASLYNHAKDANALWSICIAAAVMGLVILGQRWQQERWQVLQSKWHVTLKDEKIGKMLGSISRIKDVIVGGQRRGSLIRSSTSGDN